MDKWLAEGESVRADRVLELARDAMTAYDEFLAILSDKETRDQIENLSEDDFETDPHFMGAKAICDRFRDAIESFFFDADDDLARLTRHYGVF